ncbi:N-acetylneuraminate anomerase [Dongshaea marina]|uniref:N-acetylneuraminate anomerase n=1 Tax=Dongshaea marina TaxID=2047966 RepID=UPI000D3E873F|nr:N-acetylneuraminate anomerase [Dongshaea marina]
MFFASLSDHQADARLPKVLQSVLEYLRQTDFSKLEPGRHAVEGDKIYANLMSIETQPKQEKRPEVHRNYLDVQFLIEGEERIGVTLADSGQKVATEYDAERDLMFYQTPSNESELLLSAGMYAVFYPGELHTPACCIDEPKAIRKVVMKVHRSLLDN